MFAKRKSRKGNEKSIDCNNPSVISCMIFRIMRTSSNVLETEAFRRFHRFVSFFGVAQKEELRSDLGGRLLIFVFFESSKNKKNESRTVMKIEFFNFKNTGPLHIQIFEVRTSSLASLNY